ncbi:hypothetical protein O9H85_08095 [Paenibacillus filicis]|uniref:Uncharacterized protein n=1 Tax=Paenibacillus gyeongsangnamensis TaxID=3388067 RepID=A0ABT4Q693_9BACL|nr:hypothetical protein [Paenibacillus filicis]MCZ8512393.1 hypothetical protein [Paenibacillus filicis]
MGNNELTDGERLVKLETKLESELSAIKEALYDLKKMFLSREEIYVTKDVLDEKLKLVYKDVEGIQKGLIETREEKKITRQVLPNWVHILLSLGTLVVAVIALYHK